MRSMITDKSTNFISYLQTHCLPQVCFSTIKTKWLMLFGKIITVFRSFYDAVSNREDIASNNIMTEATTKDFEGCNCGLMKTISKNFPEGD
jgi:hypothetical protein